MELASDAVMAATVCGWLVEAELQLGNLSDAQDLLTKALERFPDYPDLRFYDFILSAKRWYEACASPRVEYLCAPMMSPQMAERFPELAARMGLPLQFTNEAVVSHQVAPMGTDDEPAQAV